MVEHDGRGFLGVMFWTVEEEGGGGALDTNDDDDDDDTEKRLTFLLNKEFKNIGRLTSEL
jgi:hypothetical protein